MLLIFLLLNIDPAPVNALNLTNQTINLQDIETKKIRVDDIDVAYKIFGKGSPILLINGYSAPLDFWDPILINRHASNHTVITFDNRGIGNKTLGNKEFSIPQVAQDTAGLMEALKINKADILGWYPRMVHGRNDCTGTGNIRSRKSKQAYYLCIDMLRK